LVDLDAAALQARQRVAGELHSGGALRQDVGERGAARRGRAGGAARRRGRRDSADPGGDERRGVLDRRHCTPSRVAGSRPATPPAVIVGVEPERSTLLTRPDAVVPSLASQDTVLPSSVTAALVRCAASVWAELWAMLVSCSIDDIWAICPRNCESSAGFI